MNTPPWAAFGYVIAASGDSLPGTKDGSFDNWLDRQIPGDPFLSIFALKPDVCICTPHHVYTCFAPRHSCATVGTPQHYNIFDFLLAVGSLVFFYHIHNI
jgi:hypothetical protein